MTIYLYIHMRVSVWSPMPALHFHGDCRSGPNTGGAPGEGQAPPSGAEGHPAQSFQESSIEREREIDIYIYIHDMFVYIYIRISTYTCLYIYTCTYMYTYKNTWCFHNGRSLFGCPENESPHCSGSKLRTVIVGNSHMPHTAYHSRSLRFVISYTMYRLFYTI